MLEITEKDAKLIWNLLPGWLKEMPKGLCPTMYGTGFYQLPKG